MNYETTFTVLIILNAMTFLTFTLVLIVFKFAYRTEFDAFHNLSIFIYMILLASQTTLAALGYETIDRFSDVYTQLFESVQTSLFFMFVTCQFYRMRSLIEGDNYFIK
jgi:hypothetical protein